MMGDSDDILTRVKKTLPRRWFAWDAPLRDALIGGISDAAAALYSFYQYAKLQTRISWATGPWLDLISYDFLGRTLPRNGMQDEQYRALIKATILKPRVTRAAMEQIVTTLTGSPPEIYEPWNTGDVGACGHAALGVSRAGNMAIPGTVFMRVARGAPGGVPNIAGIGTGPAGLGIGSLALIGPQNSKVGLTDEEIYQAINRTRPTGVAVWVQFK